MWKFPLFSADNHCGNQSGIDVVIGRLEVDNTGVGESSAQFQGIVKVYPFTIISKGYNSKITTIDHPELLDGVGLVEDRLCWKDMGKAKQLQSWSPRAPIHCEEW